MTSKWVRQVQAQRDYTVDWRFISLRLMYAAFGAHIFDTAPSSDSHRSEVEMRTLRGTCEFAEPLLAEAGLPLELADALDDESWDIEIQQETDEALFRTGKDAGTVGKQEDWHGGSRRQTK